MPIATGAQKENLAVHYGVKAVSASLHTADPGANGTLNEVSGGTPAYARQALTWNAEAAGDGVVKVSATFNVPAATTVSYAALWDGSGTPVFLDKVDLTDQTFATQGTLQVNFTYTQS